MKHQGEIKLTAKAIVNKRNTLEKNQLALTIQQEMTFVSPSVMKIVSKLLPLFTLPSNSR